MSQPIYRLTETAPPAVEPLTLEETKVFLRIEHNNDDTLISALIAAARQLCESMTGRSLITRSYSAFLDSWPEGRTALNLPRPPLLSVTRINVYAADNTASELPASGYFVDIAGVPGRVVLLQGTATPSPGRAANGIEIQFTAGYGAAAANVPALLRQGIKQLAAHLYEHRGDSPEQALQSSGAGAAFRVFRVAGLS